MVVDCRRYVVTVRMKIPIFKKKLLFFKIGICLFKNWEKGHLNSIRNGAEFRPLRTQNNPCRLNRFVCYLYKCVETAIT